jgi:CHAT domain-containing protein
MKPILLYCVAFLFFTNTTIVNAQNSTTYFPQYLSDHPLYNTALGRGNSGVQQQFDAANFLLNQYEYVGNVPAVIGYKLLSTANKSQAIIYTERSLAMSPLNSYVAEVHYFTTLLEDTTLQNNEAFENYLFSNLIHGSMNKLERKMQETLGLYTSFPNLKSRLLNHINKIPVLKSRYEPFVNDAILAQGFFENVPSENALSIIESKSQLLFEAYKNNDIPRQSYPELLYFTGRAITHHDLVSEKVNQIYLETLARVDLHPMSAFMLADRFYTNNKLKNNRGVVEVMDVALSRKRELSKPQVIGLLSKKALALQQMQSYEEFKRTVGELKPLINSIQNPSLVMEALVIVTVLEIIDNPPGASDYVLQMEDLLRKHNYLSSNYKSQVASYRNEIDQVATVTDDTDTASEYFQLSLLKLKAMDYEGMIPLLLQAKKLIDAERKERGMEVRKETELLYTRILTDLMGSHVKIGKATEALYYAELFKNKELNLLLGEKDKGSTSVKEIQNALASDEALIYYVSTGTLDNTAFFNFLITREKVSAGFFDLTKIIGQLFNFLPEHTALIEKRLAASELRTERSTIRPRYDSNYRAEPGDMRIFFDLYRSYLHPQEGDEKFHNPKTFKILSNQMWENLIPNEKFLIGKTKLIISPAGDLSFIPFETFKNTNTGKLLVEDFEISYTPSATVLVNQRSEKTRSFKKNILAFGDAKYSLRNDNSFPIKSIADVKRMQISVQNSIAKNDNLDYAFAGLQGEEPMKYLIGTKKEVDAISELVAKTDTRMDVMMTENELKKMSKSGALKDYKVIHIASHASVNPYIFEMSAVAMSVNPTPVEGEDGMITIDEMRQLDMNPELVMLSACQTGLGRITTGDTVQGLNNSLLQAGADATLTSLWSVNDYATSVFVREFYNLVFNKNKPYKVAVTQVKRDFLSGKYGDQLKNPEYWAPFIYYGK